MYIKTDIINGYRNINSENDNSFPGVPMDIHSGARRAANDTIKSDIFISSKKCKMLTRHYTGIYLSSSSFKL